MKMYKKIIEKLKSAKKIAIFAHADPDPDACGSIFGLKEFCSAIGKGADAFLKTASKSLNEIFPIKSEKTEFYAKDYDLVALVDIHSIERTDKCFMEELSKCENFVVIDHHAVGECEELVPCDCQISPEKASASQMMLELYRAENLRPTKQSATYIYAGMMGDTDRFLHSNLSEEVFDDAKYLMQCEANIQFVYDKLYRSVSKEEIIVKKFLYNNVKFLEDGKFAYLICTQEDMQKLGVSVSQVKLIANEIRSFDGVEISMLVYEKSHNVFKMSVRSSSAYDLVPFVNKYQGGGHQCAAGFQLDGTKEQMEENLPKWAKEILNG